MKESTRSTSAPNSGGVRRRAVLKQSLVGGAALVGAALGGKPREADAADNGGAPPFDVKAGVFRRVLVGNNANGKSHVIKDESVKRGEVWKTSPDNPLGPDAPAVTRTLLPSTRADTEQPKGGTRWFYAAIPPSTGPFDRATIKGWHRFEAVDHVLITNGQVLFVCDEGETMLRGGDLLVLLNGMHTWHNATSEPVGLLIHQVRA